MRAIQIVQTGGPEVMQQVDLPIGEPGPGEVRVRHHACGLNFIDTYHRSGLYPVALPTVLGVEASGIVDAIGTGVVHLAVGDRVAYAARTPGSYAEARVVPAIPVAKLPDAIDLDTAAGLILKGLTVQYLLRKTLPPAGLVPGDFILWHAAAGGVGLIACQWAAALGYRLIGTAGSPEKCALAAAHGAAHVIDYQREDVVRCVRELTGGHGVKVVYDAVGKDTWDRSLDCLQPFGLMVSFGNASGPVPPVHLAQLMAKGSLYVTRPTLGTHLSTAETTGAMADELFGHVLRGTIRISIDRRYPLDAAPQAHRDLEARLTTGSSVLIP